MNRDSMHIQSLATAVTFFYSYDKLIYLQKALSNLNKFADDVYLYIFTNTRESNEKREIEHILPKYDNISYQILTPNLLGHPYLLTWIHKDVFKHLVKTRPNISYYLYLEDDIYLTQDNIEYYLEGNIKLEKMGFIPSFVRYEIYNSEKYAIDIIKKQIFNAMPRVQFDDNYAYVNLSYPYQGLYLLSANMMKEYFNSPAYNPDYNPVWPIREMSTATISFYNVPNGYTSRNLVGCNIKNNTVHFDERCLIHHLPNKYVNDQENFKKLFNVDNIFI